MDKVKGVGSWGYSWENENKANVNTKHLLIIGSLQKKKKAYTERK